MAWVFVTIAVLAIVQLFTKLKWNGSYSCLIGKTALITGANSGMGFITALDFAKRGARVILACRNEDKAKNAKKKIIEATGNKNIVYSLVDMSSLQSVRGFAERINRTEERLDVLVNNAGIIGDDRNCTIDGIETTMQVNYVSSFLLTNLLINKLKESAPSRIINVSSVVAHYATLNLNNLNITLNDFNRIESDTVRYCNSKLCNILFTTELAERLEGIGVTVNSLHPGIVNTEILKTYNGLLRAVGIFASRLICLTPEQGAQTQIYCAVSKDVEGITGGLFTNCTQIKLYRTANNPELAKKVWQKTKEMIEDTAKN